jgi:hypothetical protein
MNQSYGVDARITGAYKGPCSSRCDSDSRSTLSEHGQVITQQVSYFNMPIREILPIIEIAVRINIICARRKSVISIRKVHGIESRRGNCGCICLDMKAINIHV